MQKKPVYNPFFLYWLIAGSVLILDQITKALVREYVPMGASKGWAHVAITHATNTGVAFGFFQGTNWFFSLIATVVIVLLGVHAKKLSQEYWTAWALILGGATGNLVDRLLFGAVTDFISIGWWPSFNVADSVLVIGVLLLLWQMRKKNSNENSYE